MQNQQTCSRKGHRPDSRFKNPRGPGRIPSKARDLTPKEAQMLSDFELSAFYAGDVRFALGVR